MSLHDGVALMSLFLVGVPAAVGAFIGGSYVVRRWLGGR